MVLKDSHQQQIVELSRGNEKAILSLKQSFEAEKGMSATFQWHVRDPAAAARQRS